MLKSTIVSVNVRISDVHKPSNGSLVWSLFGVLEFLLRGENSWFCAIQSRHCHLHLLAWLALFAQVDECLLPFSLFVDCVQITITS